MIDGELLSEMKMDRLEGGKLLKDCEVIYTSPDNLYRMYFTKPDDYGFKVKAVEWCSGSPGKKDHWEDESATVEELFTLSARKDGARHLEFNRDSGMAGYIYCPNLLALKEMMDILVEKEKEHCPDKR